ncbi:MAG TPA: transposase [Burkholderiales bacterium]|nr:transposase [Burkholderiales bacterium]
MFRRDNDYLLYLLHLRELSERHGCDVHAYCLMTNHVHLFLTPASAHACISLMRDLGQRYVQHFNRYYGRRGTLWEGRYGSFLAESARYVIACYRYIELNPVDAGMVADPAAYPWSSYAANTGTRVDSLIKPHAEFLALASEAPERHASYARLIAEKLDPELIRQIDEAANSGYPLASEAFKAHLAARLGQKTEPGRPGRPERTKRDELLGLPEIGL